MAPVCNAMMSASLVVVLFLFAFCRALNLKLQLHNLLFETSEDIIRNVIKAELTNHVLRLNFLLRLVACEYFDLNKFMTDDPAVLGPLMESLVEKKCPLEIQERFYNFDKLQRSEVGREFLIKFNANFARVEWCPFVFTRKQVRKILAKIKAYPLSQLEHLDTSALSRLLLQDDSENEMKDDSDDNNCHSVNSSMVGKFNFFGIDGNWNLFPISSFGSYNSSALKLWLDQVKTHVVNDDLLFYHLAFLSWFYQSSDGEFAESIRNLLAKSFFDDENMNRSSNDFRVLVWEHYSPKEGPIDKSHLLEIPTHVLERNLTAKATLHFEHLTAAFAMGYRVPLDRIVVLFEEFKPSLVSPFLCKRLLEYLDYRSFASLLKVLSSLEWKELYYNTHREFSYFPSGFLPAEVQLKFWRQQVLCVDDSFDWDPPLLSINHQQYWKRYIDDYDEHNISVAIEENRFTFLNCSVSQKSIIAFIEGRIVEFAIYNKRLPRFMPLLQEFGLVNQEEYNLVTKGGLVEDLCIISDDNKTNPTHEYVSNLLHTLIFTIEKWRIPKLLLI